MDRENNTVTPTKVLIAEWRILKWDHVLLFTLIYFPPIPMKNGKKRQMMDID